MATGIGSGTPTVRPSVTVEVAFATDPNSPGAATPVWTELVSRVMTIDLARSSRASELEFYQAGTATLALHNPDGMFNPLNSSGPYYGQLEPYRPIRITATWGGITYPLWQGYVERWPQTWSDPVLGISKIKCVDALALLNNISLDSAYAAEIISAAPTVYYPLSESGGNSAANHSTNPYPQAQIVHTKQVNTTNAGSYAFGATLDVVASATQSGLSFQGTNNNHGTGLEDGYVLTLPRVDMAWTGWSVELWCQVSSAAQYAVIFRGCDALHFSPLNGPSLQDPPGTIALYHSSAAKMSYLRLVSPDAGNYIDTNISFNLGDDKVHHVVITHTCPPATGGFFTATTTVYVDGQLTVADSWDVTSTATVTTFSQLGGVAVNAQTLPNSPVADGRPLIGTVGHFAIYPTVLTAADVYGHYQAGSGFVSELSGERAQRLLAYGGWQTAIQQIQQGRSTMGPAVNLSGNALLSALQDVADTEQGTLTVTADGLVDFRSRDDRMLKKTAVTVFGTDVTASEIPYNVGVAFDYDPTLIFNDIQVTRTAVTASASAAQSLGLTAAAAAALGISAGAALGITAEATDGTSIVKYFPSQKSLTLNFDSDDQAQQVADWIVGREGNPHLRSQLLTVNAGGIDGTSLAYVWPGLLGLDLHQRVGIRHRPMGAPEISMDGFVEQLTHHIDASASSFAWDVSVQVSPVLQEYGIWDDTGSTWGTAVWAF